MDWYSIDMPQGSMASGSYHRACRAFQRAFIDAGAPSDLALFARRPSEAVPRLYLTPSSARYVPDLIRRYSGCRCTVPDAGSVTLVYGVPGARALLAENETFSSGPSDAGSSNQETSIYPIRRGRSAASTR